LACKNDDGTLAESARAMLQALEIPAEAAALAARLGRPLFQVRAGLRELVEAGLAREEPGGRFAVTAAGREARAH
jgi:DNA-binding IclR family transcriptional regulator